ncbi:G-type lectin S-receptor-like serine/threonine-protein kinase At2g19130 [Panicum virgatum]|uniref:G-type lectin S-receptor-like serine/threonine-protein kinase At2g19130 n=1 Tax=Panicum virgatum TaxID=38727 RepID=UPI0019D69D9A|nr:G-type lectin S-receptor-like serine/threonine-protein kinase At2g19130 [Panicum virgatum]
MQERPLCTTMPYLHIFIALLLSLTIPTISATRDTISAGQALTIGDKLVSKNRRYALGFFEVDSNWYLGIWFNRVPKFTQAWVANRDDPIENPTSLQLIISHDDNLVITHRSTDCIIWSTQTKITRNNSTALLLNIGNFILRNASNSSDILWQSFDYPTDTYFPGSKLGWDKITGQNRRLISRKNSISPATGFYCEELDPSGVNQFILTPLDSFEPYWTRGVWNGKYFSSIPEMSENNANNSFVDNAKEKYYMSGTAGEETAVTHHYLDVSGQYKTFIWLEGSQDWVPIYAQPKAQCDVYAACGPFTICNDEALPHCTCMQGFNIRSPEDWMLDDRTGGCLRNTPIDCITNGSSSSSTDKFYSMTCVSLPQTAQKLEAAKSASDFAQACLDNCSCTAYSFSSSRCSIWHTELLNLRKRQCSSEAPNSNGETIYIRLASKDMQSLEKQRSWLLIVVATGTIVAALGLFASILLLVIWRNKIKNSSHIPNSAQYSNGIVAFRYIDLQRATKNFSEKLGGGGFGSVFKGFLDGSTAIAVKRLD